MKRDELKVVIKEIINEIGFASQGFASDEEVKATMDEGNEIDTLYDALAKVPSFEKLGMDRQGELAMKILKMIKKG